MEQGFVSLSNLGLTSDPENFRRFWYCVVHGFTFLYTFTYAEKNPKDRKTSLTLFITKCQSLVGLLIVWVLGLIIIGYSLWPSCPHRAYCIGVLNMITSAVDEYVNLLWSFFAIQRILLYYWDEMETWLQVPEGMVKSFVTVFWMLYGLKTGFEGFGAYYPEIYAIAYIIYHVYLTTVSLLSLSTGLKHRETLREYVVWPLVALTILKNIQLLVLTVIYYNHLHWFEILILSKKLNCITSLLLVFATKSYDGDPKPGRAWRKGIFRSTVGVVAGIPGWYPDLPRAENTPTNYGFWHERRRMEGVRRI